ncbi:MAG: GNAT family N-acetyltransferase [Bacteroidales bacterium]|nr:GNAT family N-acetyltransferase [Bacteroidales bacterium]
MKLEGKHILLRPVEIDDLNHLYQWENDTENWHTSNNLNPFSRFFLEQYILNAQNNIYEDKQLRLVIVTRQHKQIGIIDLFEFDPHHKRAAVGIILAPDERKKGYGSEALQVLLEYAKSVLHLKQLYAGIGINNGPSIRLFQKAGFEITGTRKSWRLHENQWIDEHFMQIMLS